MPDAPIHFSRPARRSEMNRISKSVFVGFVLGVLAVPLHSQTAPARGNELTEAIEMNTAELAIAKIAQAKAKDSRIREFADLMVKDHTQALAKLKSIPGAPSTEIKPNSKHQSVADHLA